MAKIKPYSRRQLNFAFLSWVRRNVLTLTVLLLGGAGLLALETFLITQVWSASPSVRAYSLGAVHVGAVAAAAALVYTTFLTTDRDALRHIRGAWGEENTSSELSRARGRRLVWGWVDSVPLERGDIDHLVVTRRGGIVVVDSKWRQHIDVIGRDAMVQDAHRARMRAEGLMQSLLKKERGTHRARGSALRVTPVVVVWGASSHELPREAHADGVDFVSGRRFVDWLAALDGVPVDKHAAEEIVEHVKAFRQSASVR